MPNGTTAVGTVVMGARAERFKSVLLEGGEALATVAAYIELNPVRAGLCADPEDYRYCGYAEALAKGSSLARQGIRMVLGHSDAVPWKEVSRQYRKYLFVHGSLHTKTRQPAFDLAIASKASLTSKTATSLCPNAYGAAFASSPMASSWEVSPLSNPTSSSSSSSWVTNVGARPRA